MYEDSLVNYYQNSQERLHKRYQSLSNIVVKNTKIYQKMKNKSLLSIEKNIIKLEKMPY